MRVVVVARERGLDLQAAAQPGGHRLVRVDIAQCLPQRRRVHDDQSAVLLGHLANDFGHALLHLRRQGVALAAQVQQLGQRLGQHGLCSIDLCDQFVRTLQKRRRQVGFGAGRLPGRATLGQLGRVFGRDVRGPRELGACLCQRPVLELPVALQALQPLHRQLGQLAAAGQLGQPVECSGLPRQCLLEAPHLVGDLRAPLHRLDELLVGIRARRNIRRHDRLPPGRGDRLGTGAGCLCPGRQQADERQQPEQHCRRAMPAQGAPCARAPPAR